MPFVGWIVLFLVTTLLGYGSRVETYPFWAQAVLYTLGVPILVNLFLGPAIYAFWKRKKSRGWIILLNVIFAFAGAFPGLLLWIWALQGAEE
jgi:hypothetical protein